MLVSSIIGQNKAMTLLGRAIASKRLAHAYLFRGPEGVGKTTLALAVAKRLLCAQPNTEDACGQCPSCLLYAAGNHPDVLRIQPEGQGIRIEQIRTLKKAIAFPPLRGEMRIIIVEAAQEMRREAANSLLKTLEEPPPGNIFFLIAQEEAPILGTISSRCQHIPFRALPLDQAAAIIHQKNSSLDRVASQALAALSGGCPGQALALSEENIVPLYRQIIATLKAPAPMPEQRVETALALAAALAEEKESFLQVLRLLRLFVHDGMKSQALPAAASADAQEGLAAAWARERWNFNQFSAILAAIDAAESALGRNCHRGLVSEVLLLQLFSCLPPAPISNER